MFSVYVLENDWNKRIYIGQSKDLDTRIKRHNGLLTNKRRSYTKLNKGKGNWIIIYKEEYQSRTEALKKEKYLKSHNGRDWIRKLRARSSTAEQ